MKNPFSKKDTALVSPDKWQEDESQLAETSGEMGIVDESQIQLGIKESSLEPVYKVRRAMKKMERTAEVMPFWKSEITVITLVISAFSILIITFEIFFFFSKLPINVPLFYNHITNQWELSDKSLYLFFPFVYAGSMFLVWRLIYSVFPFDRRLASVTTWALFFFSIFGTVGISEIFTLLLI